MLQPGLGSADELRQDGDQGGGALLHPRLPVPGFLGLTLPWNSGVVEEHVNRIKMLKRQMLGRAGFALLRKGVFRAS
ncbi:hypothetical protein GCM10010394_55280 [Streptomyces crystallinus]|uniref:Transposase n=1 Tax=Streptomyces crystallinus TaxID=68191 RepID=A0ABP3RUZ7_9ACTN